MRGCDDTAFFEICFFIGVIFSIVSFAIGHLFGHLGADAHLDAHADIPDSIFPVKPITVMSFLTVFGGVGIIGLNHGLGAGWAALIAFVTGLTVAMALFRWVVTPLYRAQNTTTVSQQDLIGLPATVTLDIIGQRFGSIRYVAKGSTCTAPAKSLHQTDIKAGEEVMIVKIDQNVFWVEQSQHLFS